MKTEKNEKNEQKPERKTKRHLVAVSLREEEFAELKAYIDKYDCNGSKLIRKGLKAIGVLSK